MSKIVILTGAGISAESGLGTFRDEDGLWAQHRIEDVATPEGFVRDPDLVHAFYNARRENASSAEPNAAHKALARLQRNYAGEVVIVTQNVDHLHERGGASGVIHMHGILHGALCHACDHRWTAPPEMHRNDPCPACGAQATRPDVVWFGEIPYRMEEIFDHLATADPLRLDRRLGSGLSGRQFRDRSPRHRRPYGRTQPRTFNGREPVPRTPPGPRERNRSSLGRPPAREYLTPFFLLPKISRGRPKAGGRAPSPTNKKGEPFDKARPNSASQKRSVVAVIAVVAMAMPAMGRLALQIDGDLHFDLAGLFKGQGHRDHVALRQIAVQAHEHHVVTAPLQHVGGASGDFKAIFVMAHLHDAIARVDMGVQLDPFGHIRGHADQPVVFLGTYS